MDTEDNIARLEQVFPGQFSREVLASLLRHHGSQTITDVVNYIIEGHPIDVNYWLDLDQIDADVQILDSDDSQQQLMPVPGTDDLFFDKVSNRYISLTPVSPPASSRSSYGWPSSVNERGSPTSPSSFSMSPNPPRRASSPASAGSSPQAQTSFWQKNGPSTPPSFPSFPSFPSPRGSVDRPSAFAEVPIAAPKKAPPRTTEWEYSDPFGGALENEFVVKCPICLEEKVASETYSVSCTKDHRFCKDCLMHSVTHTLQEQGIPQCPAEGCREEIPPADVKNLVPDLYQDYDQMLFKRTIKNGPFVTCQKCMFVMETANHLQGQECCECRCKYKFCSLCLQDYHYTVTCAQLTEYNHIWVSWIKETRRVYEEEQCHRAQMNQAFVAEQKKYQEDRDIALKNYDTLLKDEQHKAQKCKLCPHCNRVVEKIEGCDAMRCGADKHGGNNQSGCGKEFHWTKAAMYVAQVPNRPQIAAFAKKLPDQVLTQTHEFIPCDNCGASPIKGLRFSCLHCPAFNVCGNCEKNGFSHENGKHMFRIYVSTNPDQFL